MAEHRTALSLAEWAAKLNELWEQRAAAEVRAEKAEQRLQELEEALDAGKRFERAYQESLGATPTRPQWERLESLQSRFIDLYVVALSTPKAGTAQAGTAPDPGFDSDEAVLSTPEAEESSDA